MDIQLTIELLMGTAYRIERLCEDIAEGLGEGHDALTKLSIAKAYVALAIDALRREQKAVSVDKKGGQ